MKIIYAGELSIVQLDEGMIPIPGVKVLKERFGS